MTVSQLTRGSIVVLAVLALLTGCGGSAGGPGGAADTGSATAGTDAGTATDAGSNPDAGDSSPAAEGSGPESPQPAQGGGPSITVASLPVGGDGGHDSNDPNPAQQCGSVNWLLGPLPADVVVELGDISFDPSGIFSLGGSGCPSDQPTCQSGTHWTTDNSGCGVPVIQGDPNADSTVSIVVAGTVHCASQAECDQLAEQLKSGSGTQATITAVPFGSSSSGDSSSEPPSSESPSSESASSESASSPPGS
ncbi:MAG TPA: hypothetical protein VFU36_18385 [Jatrophihabitans sp.]|nr:hypothetical protein [Jatrophihabitans sp.]